MTRRSALLTLALTPALACSRKKAKAFALIGDPSHNSDYIRTALNRDIAQDMGVSIDLCEDTTMLTAETLDGYKMLIVHRDGYATRKKADSPKIVSEPPIAPTSGKSQWWIKPEQGKAVREFVDHGGGSAFPA